MDDALLGNFSNWNYRLRKFFKDDDDWDKEFLYFDIINNKCEFKAIDNSNVADYVEELVFDDSNGVLVIAEDDSGDLGCTPIV